MGCTTCRCDASISNSGNACTPLQEVAAIIVAVPTYDSTGAKNSIPVSATLNQAYFDALVNQTDDSKRWRPLPSMKNIADLRADATFFEFDDNTSEFVHEGARKFTGLIPSLSGKGAVSPEMKAIIESIRCTDTSVYIISVGNQLIGQLSADGLSLEPIQIDEQSIYANFMKATNAQGQHIAVQFNFAASAKDENLAMFDCSELGDANLLGLKGLLDICGETVSTSTTTIEIKLKSNFGTPKNPIGAPGLVITDFISSFDSVPSRVYNETDSLNVTLISVVETSYSTYLLTFAAQTANDVIVVKPTKTGFDFDCVEDSPIEL